MIWMLYLLGVLVTVLVVGWLLVVSPAAGENLARWNERAMFPWTRGDVLILAALWPIWLCFGLCSWLYSDLKPPA